MNRNEGDAFRCSPQGVKSSEGLKPKQSCFFNSRLLLCYSSGKHNWSSRILCHKMCTQKKWNKEQCFSNHSTWNDSMSNEIGGSGTLCSQCDKERNPYAYSFDLSSTHLWKYIALAYIFPSQCFTCLCSSLGYISIHWLFGFIIFPLFAPFYKAQKKLANCWVFCQVIHGIWKWDFMIMDFISNQLFSNPVIRFWCCNISYLTHADYLFNSSPLWTKL